MKAVDNIHQVVRFRKTRLLYHIAWVLPIPLIFFLLDHSQATLRLQLFIAVIALYLLGFLYVLYWQPGYFQMTIVNENELQIRYFNMHIANGKPKTIRFHVTQMKDYRIVKKPLGKCLLILKIKTSGQTAIYPPISISLLSRKQQQFLSSFLEKVKSEVQ